MKVLQLVSSGGFFGSENVMIELAGQLRDLGMEPLIGVFNNRRNPHLEVAEVARGKRLRVEIFECSGRVDFATVRELRRFLKKEGAELLHTHGYKSNLYALASTIGMPIGRVATCHNWLGEDIKMKSYAWLDKFFLGRFDRVVAVSDSIREELASARIPSWKLATIYNGIDLKRFVSPVDAAEIRRELGIGEGWKVVGTVGRLSAEKGHGYLLEAARELLSEGERLAFVIVGDGPLRGKLEKDVSSQGERGSNILFMGTRSDMERMYAVMDVFVLPSIREGLPMALLEAMASRKPVVAARVGAIPKILEDGRSGRLVEPGDAEGLARAIREILGDPERGRRMVQNAFETVKKTFSAEGMAERYLEVYGDVTARDRPRRSHSAAEGSRVGAGHG
jgi:glycosyltransferase involved in cell wall biosynthesis